MELRREATCGRAGVRGIAVAMLATVVCGTPAAGQWLLFEPPLYRGSAEGVPLAGQDGWYVPGVGIESEWRVYHNGGSELGFDPLPAGDSQVAGAALEAPVGLPQLIEHSGLLWTPVVIMMHVAVEFDPSLPAGEEIGRMTLEPEGVSASFGWVARRDDGGAEAWTFDLLSYTAPGDRQREVLFEGLAPGVWYELRIFLSDNRVEAVVLDNMKTWRSRSVDPPDAYLAGGATGGLPSARALRFSAGAGEAPGAAQIGFAVDNIWINDREPCYQNCDRSGELDFFDFLCFQSRFAGGDPYADCDGSGVLDFFDFLCFQDMFFSGCGP